MSDDKTTRADQNRRRLLKALGFAGTGAVLLPGKWFQPIVDTIVSPAEACGPTGISTPPCFHPPVCNVVSNVSSNVFTCGTVD